MNAAPVTANAERDHSVLLKDKLAIVTGSNRGIGLEILHLFAEQGAHLIACARQETPAFTASCQQLAERFGVEVTPVHFDLGAAEEVKAAIQRIVGLRRRVDILVNNAGTASGSLFQMTSQQELRRVFEVNFFAQIQFTQAISRVMSRQQAGSIINMASVAGLRGEQGMTAYGSSKAALILATRTLASELGSSGVRVNAIAPNVARTDMYDQMENGARERLIQAAALKRPAEPREIANAALFLASDLSSYITGQVLRVDGGIL